jgi:hypothetical protein
MKVTVPANAKHRKEYRVAIEIDLQPEVLDRIGRAIQRAVLIELADIDVANDYSVALRGPRYEEQDVSMSASDEGSVLGRDPGPLGIPQLDGIWIREEQLPL